jgi:hypothetical protein
MLPAKPAVRSAWDVGGLMRMNLFNRRGDERIGRVMKTTQGGLHNA